MHRNTIAGLGVLAAGLLLLVVTLPAIAQSTNGTPMHDGTGMMGMHSDVTSVSPGQMQLFHEQMPEQLAEQMQAWHQLQGMSGMMGMMAGRGPAATMHTQMPLELQEQILAWHAQMPEDMKAEMEQVHDSMAGMHGGTGVETCLGTPVETAPGAAGES